MLTRRDFIVGAVVMAAGIAWDAVVNGGQPACSKDDDDDP